MKVKIELKRDEWAKLTYGQKWALEYAKKQGWKVPEGLGQKEIANFVIERIGATGRWP